MSERAELDTLKAGVDLVAVLQQCGLKLKKTGQNYLGRCPFHEDDTASLSANPQAQLWNCFGCQAGGDVFRFLQLREKLSFPQAVQRLRDLAGQLPAPKARPLPDQEVLPIARGELLGSIAQLYARSLQESPEAQQYLASRGLGDPQLGEIFRLGYADGKRLLAAMPTQGPVYETLLATGLVSSKGREHLRGCLVVPLEDPDQGVVGFYGRKLDPKDPVAHLYLPGPKRGVFHLAALKAQPRVVVAESVLDALSLWVAGVREVTCLFGASGLPEGLQAAFQRFGTREVVWCLDGDRAGQEATHRLSEQLSGVRSFAVTLPDEKDPNQLLTEQGPEILRQAVSRAVPLQTETPKEIEKTADGLALELDDVRYRLSLHPPFRGKLKVTVRAERAGVQESDCRDLLSYRSRGLTVQLMARSLGLPKSVVEGHFSDLLQACEAWVQDFETQQRGEVSAAKLPEMTPEEREEALDFLKSPQLVPHILADMEALGYVGEENAKLLGYLIAISRKLEKPLSGIVRSQAGAGKSALTDVVEQLCPPEDVFLYSRLSPQALTYFGQKDGLKHKLLILEERVGAEAADYSIRVLQSRQKFTQLIVVKDPVSGQPKTQVFETEGPIAYLETTTSAQINYENATRCFELELDETEEQTRRIHERQRWARTPEGLQKQARVQDVRRRHHQAQRLLEKVPVVIPYVDRLSFPTRWMRTRRDHERFLSLIEAVTFLHQHQRPRQQGAVEYVQASPADYRIAFQLAQSVLSATFCELSRDARELLEGFQVLARGQLPQRPAAAELTRRELRSQLDWADRRLVASLQELVELEYLAVNGDSQGKTQGRTLRYRLLAPPEDRASLLRGLTTPEQLEQLLQLPPTPAANPNGATTPKA